ncbi:hypothetical protein [Candidatus Vidania fulgoroideorum]
MSKLHIFDLDHTLLSFDVEYNFIIFLYKIGKINKTKICKNYFYFTEYIKGTLLFKKYIKFIYKILKKKKTYIKFFYKNLIKKNIYKKMFLILKKKKKKIISTSSFNYFKNSIYKIFKSNIISTRITKKNYKYYKIINISKYLIKKKIKKIVFYTDSINDISMINFCNFNIIINPNFKLFKNLYIRKNVNFLFLKSIF